MSDILTRCGICDKTIDKDGKVNFSTNNAKIEKLKKMLEE